MKGTMTAITEKIRKIPGMKRMNDVTLENDIRYRGPLSYRYIRIIGWCIMIVFQVYYLDLKHKMRMGDVSQDTTGLTLLLDMSALVMPLFLIAVFAVILNGQDKFRNMFILYIAGAGGLIALYFYVIERYAIRLLRLFSDMTRKEARNAIADLLAGGDYPTGHFEFNFFIDILLCLLFMYFLMYNPKKVFTGKKLMIFRLMAILPVLYEVASNVLKICASVGVITLPIAVFPFLTTKPPMMFLMFVTLALVIKNRERIFIKRGGTQEEFQRFLKTNTNSLQFSLILAVALVIFSILDKLLYNFIFSMVSSDISNEITLESIEQSLQWLITISSWGLGKLYNMLWLAPLMLLFSYTRRHKSPVFDMLIPIIAFIVLSLIFIDYFFNEACGFFVNSTDTLKELFSDPSALDGLGG